MYQKSKVSKQRIVRITLLAAFVLTAILAFVFPMTSTVSQASAESSSGLFNNSAIASADSVVIESQYEEVPFSKNSYTGTYYPAQATITFSSDIFHEWTVLGYIPANSFYIKTTSTYYFNKQITLPTEIGADKIINFSTSPSMSNAVNYRNYTPNLRLVYQTGSSGLDVVMTVYIAPTSESINLKLGFTDGSDSLENLPEAPAKEGYHFVGWYLDEALTEPFVSGMIITEDITLYAKYEINTYTVNYVINGSSYTSKTVTHGQTAENITVEEEGKTFVGWFTDSACTQSYDFGAVTSDITLYAKYEVKMITVRFVVDGELYKELKVPYGTALIGENATASTIDELSHFNVQLLSEKYETVLTSVVEDVELEAEINPAIQKWNDFGLWLGGNWKWLLPVLVFSVIVVVFVIVKIKE